MTEDQFTRRKALVSGVAATLGLAGCIGTEQTANNTAATETVVSIPGDRVPENLAFDNNGALYFGITAGEVRRLSADRIGETGLSLADTERITTLPGAIGIEVGADGAIYTAVASQDDNAGVWTVSSDGDSNQLVGLSGFPNDILFDNNRGRLLVTESNGGVVYAVGTDGSRKIWLADDRLSTEGFGANGITRGDDGTVYVAVTRAGEAGRLLEVPVRSNGDAGEANTLLESEAIFGADGITAHNGDLYVAVNSQNRVVRVTATGDTETIATADDGLVFPSDVLFGPESDNLFICNFANESPDDGAILRKRI